MEEFSEELHTGPDAQDGGYGEMVSPPYLPCGCLGGGLYDNIFHNSAWEGCRVRFWIVVGLTGVLSVLVGCGLWAQGPPPETQICQGWWQWEERSVDGAPLGQQGVDAEGLSKADCQAARERALAEWKRLYRFTSHTAGECECKDIPPTKRPNMKRLAEANRRLKALHQAVNSTLYTYSDKINDDFQTQVRSVADLGGFALSLKRHKGPRFRSADYVLAMQEIYQEIKYLNQSLKEMPSKPVRQVDTLVDRAIVVLDRLEKREAEVERQFKDYYAVEKYWFGVDEDGVLSGPFQSEEAVRGGKGQRLRYVWYLYRPEEEHPFLFFVSKERCEAGRTFWQGTACAVAPTTDLEVDALRRGDRVDFLRSAYDKYRLQ